MLHPEPIPGPDDAGSDAGPDARHRSTPERIFDAAIAEFARHGYQGATVRAICRRAGANTAAVNYHFGGKEQLYARVLEHIFRAPRQARAALRPDLEAAPAAERLHEFILNFFHEVYGCADAPQRRGELASIFIMEMAHPTPALEHIIDTYIQPDSRRLKDIVAGLLGPGASPELVRYGAGAVVAQVLHYCHIGPIIARLDPGAPPVAERVEALAALALQFSLGGLEALTCQNPNPNA
ncbi:CerR family C-terminal domain-containing protein [Desulfocurvus sp.]|jgi:AcrR family transcriptional regulator|uniref:TetR/AcrR family transcriptional regulator n=1 Tax=Desulfocurvus sp. TaxID=2871698 RepID=UPI0025BB7976|nr:CerR family C-terminal domain-containing protein [Desulfocurvus sp.]MCK9240398.1 CerR family C-terminal domain-containing protein [Desulfocurvus sp.]